MNRFELIVDGPKERQSFKLTIENTNWEIDNIKIGQIWQTRTKHKQLPSGRFKIKSIYSSVGDTETARYQWDWIEGGFSPDKNPYQDGSSFKMVLAAYDPVLIENV